MALDKQTLKGSLNRPLDDMATRETDPAKARADYVDGLADAIEAYVKSGTVTGDVTTAGTAATQKGPLLNGRII
jgi:hypothetical protein